MKKLFLLLSIGFLVITSACKKDYTCECTTVNPLGGNDYVVPYDIEQAKKKQAEDACKAKESETDNTNCELK